MPGTLHLASIGSGKTEFALERLLERIQGRPGFPKVWALLATRRQVHSFRDRLAQPSRDQPAVFNVELFDFYALYPQLLMRAGQPARRIDRGTQEALLQSLARAGDLAHFHRIAHTRGFIAVLADFIAELKQNAVDVEGYAKAARDAKDRDIAQLYRRYQDTLRQNNLVDPAGQGWLALAALRANPRLVSDVDLLLVDGFDQFTRIQAQLLAELARGIANVDITLSAPRAGTSDLLWRAEQTRSQLRAAFSEADARLDVRTLPLHERDRHPDLRRLAGEIFSGKALARRSDAIRLIARPSPAEEVKAVLRAVKKQLLAGARAGDILIIVRDWAHYAEPLRQAQSEYQLPLLLQHQPPLDSEPLLAALLDLLELAPHFRRGDLLDALRSPYFSTGLSGEEIDLLDGISRDQQFTRGTLDDWARLVRRSNPDLAGKLRDFLGRITPPGQGDCAACVNWLGQLIGSADDIGSGSLDMAGNLERAGVDEAITERDRAALAGLQRSLGELLNTDTLLRAALGGRDQVGWDDFYADFRRALAARARRPSSSGLRDHALVAAATEARGLPHRHVYILGLAEGVFPAPLPEDPLYLDTERDDLRSRGLPLPARADRSDDRSLFAELISLARESLTLSRPTIRDGKIWLESALWRAVRTAFPGQEVAARALGHVPDVAEAASPGELMLAIAGALGDGDQGRAAGGDALIKRLTPEPRYHQAWARIARGQAIEFGRLSRAPHDSFSGQLSRASLREVARRRLGPERVFSASQLKDYGLCGYRYFAKRLLRLEEVVEPAEGYDALQLGSLFHKILEETYGRIKAERLVISEDNQERALAIYDEAAEALLRSAPRDFAFKPGITWGPEQQVLKRRLRALIEKDFSEDSPLNRGQGERRVHDLERRFDDIPVPLPGQATGLRIRGFIDRIDEIEGDLLLLDYKTGGAPINRVEMENGRDFQMLIYAKALLRESENSDQRLAGGMFWHLRSLNASGVFDVDDEDDQAAMDMALAHIADYLRRGRDGQFAARPNAIESGKCVRYCEFARLCRMQVTNPWKRTPS